MICVNKGIFPILMVALIFVLGPSTTAQARDHVSFNKEAVFCAYFKMSQEVIVDQDIEELLMAMGQPAFSDFKPSEIFTRQTIRQKRAELDIRIARYSEPLPMKWRFECLPSKLRSGFSAYYLRKHLPFATHYIRSEISRKDLMAITKQLREISKAHRFQFDEKVRIDIHLQPVKWENHTRERTMALQKTLFPIRYVVYKPLLVEVVPEGRPQPVKAELRQWRAMLSR